MRLIDAGGMKDWIMKYIPSPTGALAFIRRTLLNAVDEQPTVEPERGAGGWISVKDRLPAETHSIFWPWYGRKEWRNAMWREQSDEVLVTVTFKDGTRLVTTGKTHDGEWHTSISRTLNPIVTHWMQMPELPEVTKNG